jgi:hypothetical protein
MPLKVNKPQQQQAPIPEATEPESNPEGYPVNLQFDELENRVTFQLYDGTQIELKSPKGKQFLQIQSWYQSAPEEYRSDVFSSIKLAHTCMVSYIPLNSKLSTVPSFEDFLDTLEVEDIERVGSALTCFRAVRKLQDKQNPV